MTLNDLLPCIKVYVPATVTASKSLNNIKYYNCHLQQDRVINKSFLMTVVPDHECLTDKQYLCTQGKYFGRQQRHDFCVKIAKVGKIILL